LATIALDGIALSAAAGGVLQKSASKQNSALSADHDFGQFNLSADGLHITFRNFQVLYVPFVNAKFTCRGAGKIQAKCLIAIFEDPSNLIVQNKNATK
jgi:hypothetical protein